MSATPDAKYKISEVGASNASILEYVSETIRQLVAAKWAGPSSSSGFIHEDKTEASVRFISEIGAPYTLKSSFEIDADSLYADPSNPLKPNDMMPRQGENMIRFRQGDTVRHDVDVGPNHNYLSTPVYIDIFGTETARETCAHIINDIVLAYIPNAARRLTFRYRLSGPSLRILSVQSKIRTFDRQYVEFIRVDDDTTSEAAYRGQLSGELGCIWAMARSPS